MTDKPSPFDGNENDPLIKSGALKFCDELENKIRIISLKKAAIVMNKLADSFTDERTASETKSLAWSISWAVAKLEDL